MTRKQNIRSSYGKPTAKRSQMVPHKKKRKPKPKRNTNRSAVKAKLCRAITARVDPFCADCCCGPMDPSSVSCFTQSSVSRFAVTTDANGYFVSESKQRLVDMYYSAATFSGATVATLSAGSDIDGYDATIFDKYRITSHGVRYFASTAANTSQGIVGIATAPGDLLFKTNSTQYEHIEVVPQYEADISTVVRMEDAPEYKEYDSTSTGADMSTYVFGYGLEPSTTVGYIEVVFNLELRGKGNSTIARLAKPATPSVPPIHAAVQNVKAKVPAIHKQTSSVAKTIGNIVKDEAELLLATYGPSAIEALLAFIF